MSRMGCPDISKRDIKNAKDAINRALHQACECATESCECRDIAVQAQIAAQASAESASNDANQSEAIWNDFQTRYLGAFPTAPVTTIVGALYWNTTSNQMFVWNGTSWQIAVGGGSVFSVATGTGLTGGPITTSGTISLANTTVTPGNYTNTNLTVDAQGRLTAASNGTAAPTGANPTATISGVAVNGTASTFMRSDASPALANTAVTPGSYTNTNLTVDSQGRITAASSGINPTQIFQAYEHFITSAGTGPLGMTYAALNGGSVAQVTTNPAVFGAVRIATANNSTANTGARINGSGNINNFNPTGVGEFRFVSRIMQFSTDFFSPSCRGIFRTGLGDVINNNPTNGFFFSAQESNTVNFNTVSGGVTTSTPTGFSILQNQWNLFEFTISASGASVVAKINGTTVATHTTNIPNAYMFPITNMLKYQADAGLVQLNVDYIYISLIQ